MCRYFMLSGRSNHGNIASNQGMDLTYGNVVGKLRQFQINIQDYVVLTK